MQLFAMRTCFFYTRLAALRLVCCLWCCDQSYLMGGPDRNGNPFFCFGPSIKTGWNSRKKIGVDSGNCPPTFRQAQGDSLNHGFEGLHRLHWFFDWSLGRCYADLWDAWMSFLPRLGRSAAEPGFESLDLKLLFTNIYPIVVRPISGGDGWVWDVVALWC